MKFRRGVLSDKANIVIIMSLEVCCKVFISLHNAEALTEGTETEEVALEKAHLGVLYEREWYLRKLRALEVGICLPILFE